MESYYERNKERLNNYQKLRYCQNKEKISQYNKQYYNVHKQMINFRSTMNRLLNDKITFKEKNEPVLDKPVKKRVKKPVKKEGKSKYTKEELSINFD